MVSKKNGLRVDEQPESLPGELGGQASDGDAVADGSRAGRKRVASRLQGEIGRAEILGKYWELANLDPEITKGTITGQLKALDSLCQELGLQPPAQEKSASAGTGEGAVEVYRSAWMRSSGSTQ